MYDDPEHHILEMELDECRDIPAYHIIASSLRTIFNYRRLSLQFSLVCLSFVSPIEIEISLHAPANAIWAR